MWDWLMNPDAHTPTESLLVFILITVVAGAYSVGHKLNRIAELLRDNLSRTDRE